MNIPELCIRRPVMTTLIMAAIVIFGVFAYRVLPVAELPNVDFRTIEVSARLPGSNPEAMAASVATPLENRFSVISGLPLGPAELEALAGELKRRCGSGGTVRDGRIEIQGDHRDLLVAELATRGYQVKRAGG